MKITWLVILLVCVLTGCATIPTVGPVTEVSASQPPTGGLEVLPVLPKPGASPTQIAVGFARAMTIPDSNYATARKYLTADIAETWRPSGTVIYRGDVRASTDSARFEGEQVGRLDLRGVFTADKEEISFDLGLVRQDGQWRISTPPENLMITWSDFANAKYYSQATLYFMSHNARYVVPVPIHVATGLASSTSLLAALCAGPPEEWAGIINTAIPSTVTIKSIEIDQKGVAGVKLEGLDEDLSQEQRRQIGAQLLWTLASFSLVKGLKLSSENGPVKLPEENGEGVLELVTQQGYQALSRSVTTTQLYGVADSRPGHISGHGGFAAWASPDEGVSELSISLDGTTAAAINRERTAVFFGTPSGTFSKIDTSYRDLRSAQFVADALWLLGDDELGVTWLLQVTPSGNVQQVSTQLPSGAKILDFAVSPTRTRTALTISVFGAKHLGVADVSIGENRLGPWQELPLWDKQGLLPDISQVSWHAETSLALLVNHSDVAVVYTALIDGSIVTKLPPAGGKLVELAVLPRVGSGAIAARNSSGVTWLYDENTWTRATDQLEQIAFPA